MKTLNEPTDCQADATRPWAERKAARVDRLNRLTTVLLSDSDLAALRLLAAARAAATGERMSNGATIRGLIRGEAARQKAEAALIRAEVVRQKAEAARA